MGKAIQFDKYNLWRKNWPKNIPPKPIFPFGEIPVSDCVKRHAERSPDRIAAIFYGREVSFKEWDDAADRLAAALADMGYKKGDRVLLYMHNSPQVFIAYIAAVRLGMIVFTADPSFKEFELEYELRDCGASLVFAYDQNYPYVKAAQGKTDIKNVIVTSFHDYLPAKPTLPPHPIMALKKESFPNTFEFLDLIRKYPPNPPKVNIGMEEEELVLYTGGTTGLPKGAVHTHMNTLWCGAWAHQVRDLDVNMKPCRSTLVFGPLGHVGALSHSLFPSSVHGRTCIILARYDADTAMQAIDTYKAELFVGTVPIIQGLLGHPRLKEYDLSSVKKWLLGEWMVWLTPELASEWEKAIGTRPVKWGYGQTETINVIPDGTRIGYELPFKDKFIMAAVPPDAGFDIRIVDFETREDLPPGQKGEIVMKAPARCKYYWNKPKETAESLSPEGWLYSGDVGMLDEEGYLYWYGRKKYLIRVSGFQVSGGEIEMIGRQCPDIANIAVIGIPDPRKGEVPKAFVELKPGSQSTAVDIEAWFKQHISSYKVPVVEILPQLPLTPKGSIDMKALQSRG
jgi:long-chain acyl-CoA synthetase